MTKKQHIKLEIESAKRLEDDNLVYLWTSIENKKKECKCTKRPKRKYVIEENP